MKRFSTLQYSFGEYKVRDYQTKTWIDVKWKKNEWVFDDKNVRSKSHNSPYLNRDMTGRAVAIVNKGQLQLNTLK